MNFNQWLNLYTERMDDTPGLEQFGRESWNACKEEVFKILRKHTVEKKGFNWPDIVDTVEEIKNL